MVAEIESATLSQRQPNRGGHVRHQARSNAMRDTFLLKLLAVEAVILVTVGVLAVMQRNFFAWLFS